MTHSNRSPDDPTRAVHGDEAIEPVLLIDKQPSTWTFTLNRPGKMNALSADLVESLIDGLEAAHREGVPTLIFQGNGKNFSAGFDFGGLDAQSEGDLVLRFIRVEILLQTLAALPALTVGLAHGRNFGAGVDLFAVCKHRICTDDATFRMPGLKFGLILGSRRYAAIVGRDKAVSVLGNARTFDATEALQCGFVHAIRSQTAWPDEVSGLQKAAQALDPETRAHLYRVLDDNRYDADLAELVRSAARPGLKERIRQYLKG